MSDKKVQDHKGALERVAIAAQDGSTAFPRFRSDQLTKLYNAVSAARESLVEALHKDGATRGEAEVELFVTLQHVANCVKASEFKLLQSQAANGAKTGNIHKPVGLVAVLGHPRAPLSSLVIPMAYAVQSGNAVVLTLPESASHFNSAFREAFATLDRFSFALVGSQHTSDVLALSPALVVNPDQLSSDDRAHALSKGSALLPATPPAYATVVVDREQRDPTKLALIARYVVRGKFFALGRLAGSVQNLVVHEDRAADLHRLILAELRTAFGIDASASADYARPATGEADAWTDAIRNEAKRGTGRPTLGGAATKGGSFAPTLMENVSSVFLRQRVTGPILPVEPFVSLEGALAALDRSKSNVVFAFMESDNLAYLAAESACSEIYANAIPTEALFTPLSAITEPASYRRTTRVVSTTPLQASQNRLTYLFAPFTSAKLDFLRATLPLGKHVTERRTKHSVSVLRVFFLQGVFLILGTALTVIFSSAGFGGWTAFKWIRGRYFASVDAYVNNVFVTI